MIFITIQGAGQGGKHESVKDGKKLDELAWNDEISRLLNFIDKNNIDANDEVFTQIGTQYFCTQAHPLKDIYGRTRLAMLWWDENESLENLKLNLELMGLNDDEFIKNFEAFKQGQKNQAFENAYNDTQSTSKEQKQGKKDRKILFAAVAALAALGALAIILSKE